MSWIPGSTGVPYIHHLNFTPPNQVTEVVHPPEHSASMLTTHQYLHTSINVEKEIGNCTHQLRPVEGEGPNVPWRWPRRDPLEPGTEIIVDVCWARYRSLERANGRVVAIADGSKILHGCLGSGSRVRRNG